MRLIYLLHFYQPDFQFKQVLEEVYYNSYKKIFEVISNTPNAKVIVNITASTIEMLNNYGIGSIIDDLKDLYHKDKIEFTATSLAHVLLSHTTPNQAKRQINLDINKKSYYLNIPKENLQVLFPPEISVNKQVLDIAKELKLNSVIISHSSLKDFKENNNKLQKGNLKLYVRSLLLSRMCESLEMQSIENFNRVLNEYELNQSDENTYLIAHDAEILGYQNNGKLEFFKKLLNQSNISFTTFSESFSEDNFVQYNKQLIPATWEKMPVNGKLIDLHWENPNNNIHKYQWKLSKLVVKEIENFPKVNEKFDLQTYLDYCQYSCQYWWASSYPFWSPGIVSHAAWTWLHLSYKVFYELGKIDPKHAELFIAKSEKYYMRIIESLARYDITKWHERNIQYYDQFIHPLKLAYKL